MASIELRKVTRAFDGRSRAVDALDLSILDGERLVVLGPSGSGKTTILRLIAGLDVPTAGDVRFDGESVAGRPPHRRDVAMVFQNPALYPHLNVAANLEFGLKARGVPRSERTRRTGEVAGMLGIERLLRRRPATLSGGERQRVALGRAVVRRPAVLLLDEPFSSLDLPLRAALRRELIDLHEAFRPTLVHVTHDQGEALSVGQRVAVLDRGRLVQVASPRELYEHPAEARVATFVGSPPMNLIPCTLVRDGARARLRLDGREAWIDPPPLARDRADGEPLKVLLGIRPEHMRVRPDDGSCEPPNEKILTLRARLRRAEFQGDSISLSLELAGTTAVAKVGAGADLGEGREVAVSLRLEDPVWYWAETAATGSPLPISNGSTTNSP